MLTEIKLAIAAAAFLVTALGAGYVTHRFDNVRYITLEAKYASAESEAKDQQAAKLKLIHDHGEVIAGLSAIKQGEITTRTIINLKEVTRYVHETKIVGCITYGFVRVLDAQVHGVSPADLPLPAGLTDDACAPVDAVALANSIVANYGAAKANAEQLNSLAALN